MVNFGGEKMSKSLGNVVTIRKVAETHDLEALRLLLISVHYRSPVSFTIGPEENGRPSFPDLDEAEARLEYFYRTLERLDGFLAGGDPRAANRRRPNSGRASRRRWTTTSTPRRRSDTCTTRSCWPTSCSTSPSRCPSPSDWPRWAHARDLRDAGQTLGILQRAAG